MHLTRSVVVLLALASAATGISPAASAQRLAPLPPAPPQFHLTLLPVPTGTTEAFATSVNERGQVLGQIASEDTSGPLTLQVHQTGLWTHPEDAPVLATGAGATFSHPMDLGDSGLAVVSAFPDSIAAAVAFTWTPGEDLEPVPTPGLVGGTVTALNERGVLVGYAGFPGIGGHPARWVAGVPQDLGVLPGDETGTANAISESGHIVGTSGYEAAHWFQGTIERLDFPGASLSVAIDVNDQDEIVGQATMLGGEKAVFWRGANGIELPTLGGHQFSTAYAINNHSWIVGSSQIAPPISPEDAGARAALWLDGQVQDLNALTIDLPTDVVLIFAWDVNDAGQIVGQGTVRGEMRPFLLDPVSP